MGRSSYFVCADKSQNVVIRLQLDISASVAPPHTAKVCNQWSYSLQSASHPLQFHHVITNVHDMCDLDHA